MGWRFGPKEKGKKKALREGETAVAKKGQSEKKKKKKGAVNGGICGSRKKKKQKGGGGKKRDKPSPFTQKKKRTKGTGGPLRWDRGKERGRTGKMAITVKKENKPPQPQRPETGPGVGIGRTKKTNCVKKKSPRSEEEKNSTKRYHGRSLEKLRKDLAHRALGGVAGGGDQGLGRKGV